MADREHTSETRPSGMEGRQSLVSHWSDDRHKEIFAHLWENRERGGVPEFPAVDTSSQEILPPAIEVIIVRKVFVPDPTTHWVEGEMLLLDLVEEFDMPPLSTLVWVNENRVSIDMWTRTIVEPGDKVLLRLLPTGGDNMPKILQTILTVFAMIISVIVPAGYAGVPLLFGAMANVVISLAFPPPSVAVGDPGELKNSPQLSGSRNTFRAWTPLPVVVGEEYRVWPPLGARPYTEVVGGEQYLRMLFVVNHGPCEIPVSEIKIGTDPISNFEDVEVEIRQGKDSDSARELYTTEVVEKAYAFVLETGVPFLANTEPDTLECTFDFTYPYGFGGFHDETGKLLPQLQKYHLEYREMPSGSWVDMQPLEPYGPGVTYLGSGVMQFKSKRRGLCQRGFRFVFPSESEWQVRVTMTENTAHSGALATSVMDACHWTTFRSIWPSEVITLDNVATISLRIRASEQLNGIVDTLNCLVKPLVALYSAVLGWQDAEGDLVTTGNPAWHFANVLRGPAAVTPVDDTRLDSQSILDWANYCDHASNNFEVAGVIDTEQPKEHWLAQIAATTRAKVSLVNSMYSIIIDDVRDTPVQLLTDRNSSNLRGRIQIPEPVHAIRVRFVDKESNYQIAERLVCNDGYTEETATKIQELDMWGIADPDLAYKHGRYHMAAGELRRRIMYLDVDFENIICNRGDRVDVQNASTLAAVGTARVTQYGIIFGIHVILFDSAIALEPLGSVEYQVQIRKADGVIQTFDAYWWNTPAEDSEGNTGIAFTGTITGDDPAWGDLIIIGVKDSVSLPMIVTGIEHKADLVATLELMDYSPAIFTADQGEIPDWDPNITAPIHIDHEIPNAPTILSVISDESALAYAVDKRVVPRALMSFTLNIGKVTPTFVQGQYRITDDGDNPDVWHMVEPVEPSTGQISFFVEENETYDFRIRCATDTGLASEWVYELAHYVIGRTTPPPDPQDLQITPANVITWDMPFEPLDLAGYKIRYQQGQEIEWSTGIEAHGGVVTEREVHLDAIPIVPTGIEITLMVKSIDVVGIESEGFAYLITTLPSLERNVIWTQSAQPTWVGFKINCSVVSNQLHADTDTGGFWTTDPQLFWTQDTNLFWTNKFKTMEYITITGIPVGTAGVLRIPITGQGQWEMWYQLSPGMSSPLKWPGEVNVQGGENLGLSIMIPGGPVQGQLHTLDVNVDVPDRIESHLRTDAVPPVTNGVAGGQRHAPNAAFNAILECRVTIAGQLAPPPAAQAVGYTIWDLNPVTGPLVEIFDNTGVTIGAGVPYELEYIGY